MLQTQNKSNSPSFENIKFHTDAPLAQSGVHSSSHIITTTTAETTAAATAAATATTTTTTQECGDNDDEDSPTSHAHRNTTQLNKTTTAPERVEEKTKSYDDHHMMDVDVNVNVVEHEKCQPIKEVSSSSIPRDEDTFAFLDDFGGTALMSNANIDKTKDVEMEFPSQAVESGIQALTVNAIHSDFTDINLPQFPASSQGIGMDQQQRQQQQLQQQQQQQPNIVPDEISSMIDSFHMQENEIVSEKEFICMGNNEQDLDYDSDDGPPTQVTFRIRRNAREMRKKNHQNDDRNKQPMDGNQLNGMMTPAKRCSTAMDCANSKKMHTSGDENAMSDTIQTEGEDVSKSKKDSRTFQNFLPIRPAQTAPVMLATTPKAFQTMGPSTCFMQRGMSGPMYVTCANPYATATPGPPMYVSHLYTPHQMGPVFVGHPSGLHNGNSLASNVGDSTDIGRSGALESASSKDTTATSDEQQFAKDPEPSNRECLVQPPAKLEHHSALGRLQLDDGTSREDDEKRKEAGETNARRSRNRSNSRSKTPKKRLVWSKKLHERFVKAVRAGGGIDKAVPRQLLKYMNVEGLTSEHVKSHLQKYRNTVRKAAEEIEKRSADIDKKEQGKPHMPTPEKLLIVPTVNALASGPNDMDNNGRISSKSLNHNGGPSAASTDGGANTPRAASGKKLTAASSVEEREVEGGLSATRGALPASSVESGERRRKERDRLAVGSQQRQQVEKQLALQERTMRLQLQMQIIVHRMVTLQRKLQDGIVQQGTRLQSRQWIELRREQDAITNEFKTMQRELERQQELLKTQMAEQEDIRRILASDAEAIVAAMDGRKGADENLNAQR